MCKVNLKIYVLLYLIFSYQQKEWKRFVPYYIWSIDLLLIMLKIRLFQCWKLNFFNSTRHLDKWLSKKLQCLGGIIFTHPEQCNTPPSKNLLTDSQETLYFLVFYNRRCLPASHFVLSFLVLTLKWDASVTLRESSISLCLFMKHQVEHLKRWKR